MDEKDHRQLQGMKESLRAYRLGKINLSELITDLEILQNGLSNIPEKWIAEFRKNWGILEQVYSFAVVYEESIDSHENDELILPALAKLEKLIAISLDPEMTTEY